VVQALVLRLSWRIWRLVAAWQAMRLSVVNALRRTSFYGRRINRKQLDYLAFVGATRGVEPATCCLPIGAAGLLGYPGVKAVASFFTSGLEGSRLTKRARPEGFEELMKASPKALYCMPTVQNPPGRS